MRRDGTRTLMRRSIKKLGRSSQVVAHRAARLGFTGSQCRGFEEVWVAAG